MNRRSGLSCPADGKGETYDVLPAIALCVRF